MVQRNNSAWRSARFITIVLSLALCSASFLLDVIYYSTSNQILLDAAFCMVTAGIMVGMIAVTLIWTKWFAVPAGTNDRCAGELANGLVFSAVLLIFVGHWHFRQTTPGTLGPRASLLSFLGASVTVVSALLVKEVLGSKSFGLQVSNPK